MVKYKYDAWGNHKILSADGVEITDEAHLGYLNPHRYRGYYYSDEMGLYYLKSRFYDPSIGRFISADSIDYLDPHTVGGLNLFAYCNNNPVMNVDPTGHAWWNPLDWNWKKIGRVATTVAKAAVSVATVTVLAAASVATGGAAAAVLAGAAIGAGVGMAGGALGAVASGGGVEEIANGMLSGTVTGAASGTIAAGPAGVVAQVVANAGLGGANYVMNQSLNGDAITLGGLGTSISLGAAAGVIGGSGWTKGNALGLSGASLSRNGLKFGLGVAGSRNLARLGIPALIVGVLGGYYGRFNNRYNATGAFVGF